MDHAAPYCTMIMEKSMAKLADRLADDDETDQVDSDVAVLIVLGV